LYRIAKHFDKRIRPVRVCEREPIEAPAKVGDGHPHDLEQAMLLRLEVVIERRRADSDRRRHVGPLRLLVAVASEAVDCDVDDLLPLDPGLWPRRTLAAFSSCHVSQPLTSSRRNLPNSVRGNASANASRPGIDP